MVRLRRTCWSLFSLGIVISFPINLHSVMMFYQNGHFELYRKANGNVFWRSTRLFTTIIGRDRLERSMTLSKVLWEPVKEWQSHNRIYSQTLWEILQIMLMFETTWWFSGGTPRSLCSACLPHCDIHLSTKCLARLVRPFFWPFGWEASGTVSRRANSTSCFLSFPCCRCALSFLEIFKECVATFWNQSLTQ